MFYLVVGVKLKRKVSACVMFSLDIGIVVSILNMGEWRRRKKAVVGVYQWAGSLFCFSLFLILLLFFSFVKIDFILFLPFYSNNSSAELADLVW